MAEIDSKRQETKDKIKEGSTLKITNLDPGDPYAEKAEVITIEYTGQLYKKMRIEIIESDDNTRLDQSYLLTYLSGEAIWKNIQDNSRYDIEIIKS